MTIKQKKKLVKQASSLYLLGLNLEKQKSDLRRLVEKKVPYDSPELLETLAKLQQVDREWNQLEQEHLEYRKSLGIK